MATKVQRDVMVHIECIEEGAFGGAVCLSFEENDGQFSIPLVLEIAPFDTALDVVQWVVRQMVAHNVLAKS